MCERPCGCASVGAPIFYMISATCLRWQAMALSGGPFFTLVGSEMDRESYCPLPKIVIVYGFMFVYDGVQFKSASSPSPLLPPFPPHFL